MIEMWADVGGTFTDCFVKEGQELRAIKVLSSGATKGTVQALATGQRATRLIDGLRVGDSKEFWTGFTLRLLDETGALLDSATVTAFDPTDGGLQLDRRLEPSPPIGSAYELVSELESPALAVRRLLGLPLTEPLPAMSVRLGTTRGTNALLTRRGAAVTLVTTQGFRDVLNIGEQDRPDLFDLQIQKYPPLTTDVLEIDERLAADGTILKSLDIATVSKTLRQAKQRGADSLAICLLHAYKNDTHERQVEALASEIGFSSITRSSELAPLVKLVARAETTTLDAYLNPLLRRYVERVWQQLGGRQQAHLLWMTSGGSLVSSALFRGADSVLSGPAGGVVALGQIAQSHRLSSGAIGLDMGGTSTDVSLYDNAFRRHFESRKAGLRMLTPMMAIETVAAGGGSICHVEGKRLRVGPDSAGSEPGPACYGRGGPLTVTDLNVLLGRINPRRFPFPLDINTAMARLEQLADATPETSLAGDADPKLRLAEGFWRIAIAHMAEAVRTITTADGIDPRPLTLVGFGGAAGQHLTAVAEALGIDRVLDHPKASLLSALGIGAADEGVTRTVGVYQSLAHLSASKVNAWQAELLEQTRHLLSVGERRKQNDASEQQRFTIDLRYQGTDATLEVPLEPRATLAERFGVAHEQRFGYRRAGHAVECVAIRLQHSFVRRPLDAVAPLSGTRTPTPPRHGRVFMHGGWQVAADWLRSELQPGDRVFGPALITSETSTLVIDPGWLATMQPDRALEAVRLHAQTASEPSAETEGQLPVDAVQVEVVGRRLQGIADSMGEVLRRTAMSVNVKERRDYSCALFRHDGTLVANAPHVPVHLGAMGYTVRHLMQRFPAMSPGDVFVTNDPYAGGSHLPDVTLIQPVFVEHDSSQPAFFVGSRAHHAEIGGVTPGSMPPAATCLAEEGVLIRDFQWVRDGKIRDDELRSLLLAPPYPTRSVEENLADIAAQHAACHRGAVDLVALARQLGGGTLDLCMERLQDVSRQAVEQFITTLPPLADFEDQLDDGTKIHVSLTPNLQTRRLAIDFEGTAGVHRHGFNATPGIVTAAILYVMRCAINRPLPLNEGFMQAIDLRLPSGLLNPPRQDDPVNCPAVVAGNVETSQRIVDVLLGALQLAAASQGTMNNVLLGDESFGYYETICGGSGATACSDGADAVHTHMTNTRITDPEVLESRYPVRLWRFEIRRNSGGSGIHRGGDGVLREWEFLRPLTVSLLTGRRAPHCPYGLHGGQPGASGINWLRRCGQEAEVLPSHCTLTVEAGDRLVLETPGGGGWGSRLEDANG